jgi:epoxyqueuosine reductase QueG
MPTHARSAVDMDDKAHRLWTYAHRCATEHLGFDGQVEWCTYCIEQCPAYRVWHKKFMARLAELKAHPPMLDDYGEVI